MVFISYITLNEEKISVVDNKLDLRDKNIKEISEIIGLEELSNLEELNLRHYEITEITSLDTLENLIRLNLGGNINFFTSPYDFFKIISLEIIRIITIHFLYILQNYHISKRFNGGISDK